MEMRPIFQLLVLNKRFRGYKRFQTKIKFTAICKDARLF